MHLKSSAVGVLAAGALLAGVPAAAGAATPSTSSPSSTSNSASFSSFEQVADGQTVQQVQGEMGSAGATSGDTVNGGGFGTEVITWHSESLGGLLTYQVTFRSNPGGPLLVDSKFAF